MEASALQREFDAASELLKELGDQPPARGVHSLSSSQLLALYATFKQARLGDCSTERPSGWWAPRRAAMHDAWAALKGTPIDVAQVRYVELAVAALAPYVGAELREGVTAEQHAMFDRVKEWLPRARQFLQEKQLQAGEKINIGKSSGRTRRRRSSASELALTQAFGQATALVEALPENLFRPPVSKMLELYSLYKQGKHGECNEPAPSLLSFKERAKWNAWKQRGTMSQREAIIQYVLGLIELLRNVDTASWSAEFLAMRIRFLETAPALMSIALKESHRASAPTPPPALQYLHRAPVGRAPPPPSSSGGEQLRPPELNRFSKVQSVLANVRTADELMLKLQTLRDLQVQNLQKIVALEATLVRTQDRDSAADEIPDHVGSLAIMFARQAEAMSTRICSIESQLAKLETADVNRSSPSKLAWITLAVAFGAAASVWYIRMRRRR